MAGQAKLDEFRRLETAIKDLKMAQALPEDYSLEDKVDILLGVADAIIDAYNLDGKTHAMITSLEISRNA